MLEANTEISRACLFFTTIYASEQIVLRIQYLALCVATQSISASKSICASYWMQISVLPMVSCSQQLRCTLCACRWPGDVTDALDQSSAGNHGGHSPSASIPTSNSNGANDNHDTSSSGSYTEGDDEDYFVPASNDITKVKGV